MPRTARVMLPNCPHHVVQRGHNRSVVFSEAADYRRYLDTLADWKGQFGCRVYAYCLMTNHVHLVIDPGDDATSLGRLMKRLAGRQTRWVNRLERRSGSLWESRYKSSPIETNAYLLACCRYVELNPVRARMVVGPEHYEWSSYRRKIGQARWGWLDPDPAYLALGETTQERARRYCDWVASGVPDEEWRLIRDAVQRGQLTGSERFRRDVEARIGRRIECRGPGRPAARNKDNGK